MTLVSDALVNIEWAHEIRSKNKRGPCMGAAIIVHKRQRDHFLHPRKELRRVASDVKEEKCKLQGRIPEKGCLGDTGKCLLSSLGCQGPRCFALGGIP